MRAERSCDLSPGAWGWGWKGATRQLTPLLHSLSCVLHFAISPFPDSLGEHGDSWDRVVQTTVGGHPPAVLGSK